MKMIERINPKLLKLIVTPEYKSIQDNIKNELIHSTMKPERCNRHVDVSSCRARALEELTAEIGAAYFLAEYGIKADLQNTAAYVQSWIKELKNDKNFIFKASKDAKEAVSFIATFNAKT